MTQSIHIVDLLQYIMGPVKSIVGKVRTQIHDIEVEDTATALISFQNGAMGIIESTSSIKPALKSRIELHGERGTIVANAQYDQILFWNVDGYNDGVEIEKNITLGDIDDPWAVPADPPPAPASGHGRGHPRRPGSDPDGGGCADLAGHQHGDLRIVADRPGDRLHPAAVHSAGHEDSVTAPLEGSPVSQHRRWFIILFVFFATVLNYMDRQTLSILAPLIQKDFHLDNAQLGALFSAFYVTYGVSVALIGELIDRLSIRIAFAVAVAWWSLATSLTGLSRSFAQLFGFRLALGVGEAANWPVTARLVSMYMAPKARTLANSLYMGGGSLGLVIIGPLLVWLSLWRGWRAGFIVIGALSMLWLIAWLSWLKPRNTDSLERHDLAAETRSVASWRSVIRLPRFWGLMVASLCGNTFPLFPYELAASIPRAGPRYPLQHEIGGGRHHSFPRLGPAATSSAASVCSLSAAAAGRSSAPAASSWCYRPPSCRSAWPPRPLWGQTP